MEMNIQRDHLNVSRHHVTTKGSYSFESTILKFNQKDNTIFIAETDSIDDRAAIIFSTPDLKTFYLLQVDKVLDTVLIEVFENKEKENKDMFLQPIQAGYWQNSQGEDQLTVLKVLESKYDYLDEAYKAFIEHLVDYL